MVKYGDTRQFLLGFLALVLILLLIARYFIGHSSNAISPMGTQSLYIDSLRQNADGVEDSTTCDGGENMVYSIGTSSLSCPGCVAQRGTKIDCKYLSYLRKYGLTDVQNSWQEDRDNLELRKFPQDYTFVLAANERYYPSIRAVISSIQHTLGSYRKILLYDMGGITGNTTIVKELSGVCALEVRPFDFGELPEDVRAFRTFSWKVLILAVMLRAPDHRFHPLNTTVAVKKVLAEVDTFIYLDSSVLFVDPDFDEYFHGMREKRLLEVQMTKGTHHGVRFATHRDLLRHIPLHPYFTEDIEMLEANMIIVHRSEFTRRFFKWALLCALTRGCIEPPGAVFPCKLDTEGLVEDGTCNRLDQSVFSILIANEEVERRARGDTDLVPHRSFRHPSNRVRHILLRKQESRRRIDFCASPVETVNGTGTVNHRRVQLGGGPIPLGIRTEIASCVDKFGNNKYRRYE